MNLPRFCLAALLMGAAVFHAHTARAQAKFVANYDEARVPQYVLPDSLMAMDGKRISSARAWQTKRRPELLRLFESEVYGRAPRAKFKTRFEVTSVEPRALGGKATRKEVSVLFSRNGRDHKMDLLVYLPNQIKTAVPVFIGLNFFGNHSIHPDPGITLSTNWMRSSPDLGVVNHRATEAARGARSSRWPIETILERGYGLATIYYGDLVPDDAVSGLPQGIHRLFFDGVDPEPQGDEWGAIAAWAWGLSRAMDYFEKDKEIDHKRVAVMGHSRLGKTALWAGATDSRFAIVISNNSGCGGAALSRRQFGETVGRINTAFPHWFCGNFKKYSGNEQALPVDQHQLIALVAPRPVYVASADEDLWADPRGEFLAALHAEPVYQLFGLPGLGVNAMPPLNRSVGGFIGYHIRAGKHDVTGFDWEQYLAFADRHFMNK